MQIDQIQTALADEDLDGWLFFDHHVRDPLAYSVLGLPKDRHVTRRWYYLIPAQGEPRGLVHRIESGVLDTLPGNKSIYSRWTDQVSGIKLLLSGCRRIAMQYSPRCAVPYVSMIDGGTLELIRETGVEIQSSADLIQLFEARWTDQQLEMHLEAGRRVDRIRAAAFDHIGAALRQNAKITEWDVNRFIRDEFERAGLVTDHGPIVAVNAHMSDPHYEPESHGSAPIRKGDAVLIDMWAKLNQPGAVYYDITWTGYCGGAVPEKLQEVFRVVSSARDRGVERVKEAVANQEDLRGYQVDDAVRSVIEQAGYGQAFVHRTGHSIGEEVHGTGANMDNLETHDDRRVISGTCFSIEPGVYLPEFGIRSEVNVFVGTNEARVTGESQREIVRIS
jgi:Xaa-Pro aminopeptidase